MTTKKPPGRKALQPDSNSPAFPDATGWLRGLELWLNGVHVTRHEFADYFDALDPDPNQGCIPAAYRRVPS